MVALAFKLSASIASDITACEYAHLKYVEMENIRAGGNNGLSPKERRIRRRRRRKRRRRRRRRRR